MTVEEEGGDVEHVPLQSMEVSRLMGIVSRLICMKAIHVSALTSLQT